MANYNSLRLLIWIHPIALLMNWKYVQDGAFIFSFLLLTEKVPVTLMQPDLLFCSIYSGSVCLPSARSGFLILHSQSAEILSVICFIRQTQSSVAVYVISKWLSWIFKDALWLSVSALFHLWRSLLDRHEVTKLKFEGKTFHVYANQKEVSLSIVAFGGQREPSTA